MIPGKSEDYEITVSDNYSIAKSDKCTLVGLDLSVGEIDSSVLGEMNVSKSDLLKIAQTESEKDMQKILKVRDEDVIEMGNVHMSRFNKYLIRYKHNQLVRMVAIYERDCNCIIQITEAEENILSDKQYKKIFSGLSY